MVSKSINREFIQRLIVSPSQWVRLLSPVLSLVVILVLRLAWLPFGHSAALAPDLPAILIFHWRLVDPKMMTMAVVFLFGLADDLAGGQVLGSSSLGLLVMMILTDRSRKLALKGKFSTRWALFILCLIPASLIKYLANAFAWGVWPEFSQLLFSMAMSLASYPLAIGLIIWFSRHPSATSERLSRAEQQKIAQTLTGIAGRPLVQERKKFRLGLR